MSSSTQKDNNKKPKLCGCIFSLGFLSLSLWLLFNIHKPTCSIEDFDVFALGNTAKRSASNHNNTIHYDLKLKNRNFNKGIYYDALNLTFYYKTSSANNALGEVVGNDNFTPFYQGYHKSAHRVGDIEARGVKWKNATPEAVFRVELATSLRYKFPLWKTKRRCLMVGADLRVNGDGKLIKGKGNKGIELSRSNARKSDNSCFEIVIILGVLMFIHSW